MSHFLSRNYLIVLASASFLLSSQVQGAITNTTGAAAVISPPASTANGVLESNTQVFVFPEQQNITLSTAIDVNISLPGTSPSGNSINFSQATIPVGTLISSYFAHFDSIGSPGADNPAIVTGSITFGSDVLGLIVGQSKLDATDSYPGLPGSTYGTGQSARDLEIVINGVGQGTNDEITLSNDRRTVSFNLRDGSGTDEFRIITAAATVPEPASLSLIAFVTIPLLLRRHRA